MIPTDIYEQLPFSFISIALSMICMIISIFILKQSNNRITNIDENTTLPERHNIVTNYIKYLQDEQDQGLNKQSLTNNKSITSLNIQADKDKLPLITVFYATQSNTSKAFSLSIKSDFKDLKLKVRTRNISEFEEKDISSNVLAIFLISTYGEGEPTDDAVEVFKKLSKQRINSTNSYFKYCIFGLGSTKYEKYCQTAKNLDSILLSSGLSKLRETCFGDDADNNIRKDFDEWKEKAYPDIINHLVSLYNTSNKNYECFIKDNSLLKLDEEDKEFEIKVVDSKTKVEIDGFQINSNDYEYPIKSYISSKECTLIGISELRKDNINGSTIKLTYEIGDMTYEHGDNIGVYPTNKESDVMFLIQRLSFDPESKVYITKHKQKLIKKIDIQNGLTIREYLTSIVDFNRHVTKQEIQDILKFTKDQGEYDTLNNLIQEETLKKTEKSNLNILDLLTQFPSINMTFIEFYSLCGKIAPRFYTVASSNKNTPGKLEIAISLIGHNTHLLNNKEEFRYGLTSSYVKNITHNFELYKDDKIKTRLIVRESGFKMPHNNHMGLIMICTGTGVAPFISFLREMLASNIKRDCLLFFGSKNSAYDFIYEDEIREYVKNGTLTNLYTAFSRDSDTKEYVQNRILSEKDVIIDFINNKNSNIFICGGVHMGSDVMKSIESIIGINKVKQIENDKRLFKELWG